MLALLLHSLNGTRHTAKAAKQRSLKDFHKTFVEKYKEDRAALPLFGKQRLGIQVTCQFHLIDQDRKPWA